MPTPAADMSSHCSHVGHRRLSGPQTMTAADLLLTREDDGGGCREVWRSGSENVPPKTSKEPLLPRFQQNLLHKVMFLET